MKTLEKITIAAATLACSGYLVRNAIRERTERALRLAAGESPYERAHPKPRSDRKVCATA
jgi:hypothetical protein